MAEPLTASESETLLRGIADWIFQDVDPADGVDVHVTIIPHRRGARQHWTRDQITDALGHATSVEVAPGRFLIRAIVDGVTVELSGTAPTDRALPG